MEASLQNAQGHLQSLLSLSSPNNWTSRTYQSNAGTMSSCFLSYQQDDWANILHFAEFAYNNSIHFSTRVTPFYAYTDYHPHWCMLETPELPTNPSEENHFEWLR